MRLQTTAPYTYLLSRLRQGRHDGVAQIFNLLYRRITFGTVREFPRPVGIGQTSGGLQTRDTADWKSALQGCRNHVVHPAGSSVGGRTPHGVRTSCSPSPRPSPLGRGRILRRGWGARTFRRGPRSCSANNPTSEPMERASEFEPGADCCSLSPRERVRVRGKATPALERCPETGLCDASDNDSCKVQPKRPNDRPRIFVWQSQAAMR